MIKVRRLNGKEFVLNADLIRTIEATPDTLITLLDSGDKLMVLESVDEVVKLIIEYRQRCFQGALLERK